MAVSIEAKWEASNITSSAYSYSTITPSDTTDDAAGPFKAIYVGGAGAISIVRLDNTVVLFSAAIAGSILPVIGRRVNALNTTASLMVGLR